MSTQQFVHGDDVAAGGAAAALAGAVSEQVALGAAAFIGERVPAAGAFVDAAGRL